MNRIIKKFILCFSLLLISSSCLFAGNERLKVFVSILPQKYFAEKLLGENGKVEVLIGPGMSPHTFEPLPKQMSMLSKADIYFSLGIPFEKAVIGRLKNICPNLLIIATDKNIEKIPISYHHHEDHKIAHNHEIELDPHFWLDPLKAYIMAENMANAIIAKIPNLKETIINNLTTLKKEMTELDNQLTKMLLPFKGKTMLVFHPAFGYFTNKYGLDQKAVELEGKEPTPKQLAELIRSCKLSGIKVIFVQKQFPVSAAKTVSLSIGGRVVAIDPLAEDYVSNLKAMAQAFVDSAK